MADVTTAMAAARSKLGARYVWGAEGPDTFDCSGLMQWAWKQAGVSIPRTSQQQAKYGTAVPLGKIQAGDLVTSDWGAGPSSHVAMYLGGGRLIHAPKPGDRVRYATLDASYAKHINAIRRVPGAKGAPPSDGAQYASWLVPGPVGDRLEDLGDALGSILGNEAGIKGTILEPLGHIARGTVSAAQSLLHVGRFAEFLMKLALPSTWVRIVCGLLGTVLLFLGIAFLIRETRSA